RRAGALERVLQRRQQLPHRVLVPGGAERGDPVGHDRGGLHLDAKAVVDEVRHGPGIHPGHEQAAARDLREQTVADQALAGLAQGGAGDAHLFGHLDFGDRVAGAQIAEVDRVAQLELGLIDDRGPTDGLHHGQLDRVLAGSHGILLCSCARARGASSNHPSSACRCHPCGESSPSQYDEPQDARRGAGPAAWDHDHVTKTGGVGQVRGGVISVVRDPIPRSTDCPTHVVCQATVYTDHVTYAKLALPCRTAAASSEGAASPCLPPHWAASPPAAARAPVVATPAAATTAGATCSAASRTPGRSPSASPVRPRTASRTAASSRARPSPCTARSSASWASTPSRASSPTGTPSSRG